MMIMSIPPRPDPLLVNQFLSGKNFRARATQSLLISYNRYPITGKKETKRYNVP